MHLNEADRRHLRGWWSWNWKLEAWGLRQSKLPERYGTILKHNDEAWISNYSTVTPVVQSQLQPAQAVFLKRALSSIKQGIHTKPKVHARIYPRLSGKPRMNSPTARNSGFVQHGSVNIPLRTRKKKWALFLAWKNRGKVLASSLLKKKKRKDGI